MTNEQFMAEYYPEYQSRIERMAYRIAEKHDVIYLQDDMVQEGLMAIRDCELSETQDNSGYIMAVARNIMNNVIRSEMRQTRGFYGTCPQNGLGLLLE